MVFENGQRKHTFSCSRRVKVVVVFGCVVLGRDLFVLRSITGVSSPSSERWARPGVRDPSSSSDFPRALNVGGEWMGVAIGAVEGRLGPEVEELWLWKPGAELEEAKEELREPKDTSGCVMSSASWRMLADIYLSERAAWCM